MPKKGPKPMNTAVAEKSATNEPEAVRVVVLFEPAEQAALDALVDRLNAQARERREARRHNRSTVIREAVAMLDASSRAAKPKP
jgi:hypothetical protein